MRIAGLLYLCMVSYTFANPTISNVRVSQRENTKLVDILYDVSFTGGVAVAVSCEVSTNAGVAFDIPVSSFSGSGYGAIVSNGTDRLIVWNAGIDWNENYSDQMVVRITATPPRFVVNGDGTVTDSQTDLVWGRFTESGLTYSEAVGMMPSGWRLPTYDEYYSLADVDTISGLPYGHPFEITPEIYWTTSVYGMFKSTEYQLIMQGFCFYQREGSDFSPGNVSFPVPFIPIGTDFIGARMLIKEVN